MAIRIGKSAATSVTFTTPQEIIISHGDDSIRIGDGSTLVGVTATGELKVAASTTTLTTRVDEASASVTYIGKAVPGTSEASASWQLQKLTISGTITTIAFADGDELFNNSWSNRASATYT